MLKFIEEELVKIPFNVFSNTISLSVNDFKSFVKLSPADKRKIIDKIFGLDLVNDMNQLVKEDAKTVRGKQTSSQTALTKNQHLLEQSVQQLSNLQEDLTQEKENRIVQLNDILVRAAEKQSEVKSSYSEIKIKLDSAKTDLKTVRESKSACTFNIAEIDKKLSIYAKNKCPHCLSDLTDTVHIGIKQQLEENKSRFQEELTPIATKISEIEFGARDLEASQEKFRNDHAKLSSALDSAKRELDSLTQSQDSEKQTQYLQKIIDQLNEDIESWSGIYNLHESGAIGSGLKLSGNGGAGAAFYYERTGRGKNAVSEFLPWEFQQEHFEFQIRTAISMHLMKI